MAQACELETLNKAFSGHGIHEQALISILGKWEPEERNILPEGKSPLLQRGMNAILSGGMITMSSFSSANSLRFKNAVVLWTMHPWERDARLVKEALEKGPQLYGIIVEVACTRSAEELLGARRAYHSLFDHSIEEDVAHHIKSNERKLLVALVSAYRYEGTKVKEDAAKSEAKELHNAIKNADKRKPIEDDEVVRILTTRSKPHLQAIYKHYKEISGKNIDEDLDADLLLKDTVQCLCTPPKYFSKVLDTTLEKDVDKMTKKALTRVIVTRADTDMKEIKEEYNKQYGVSLSEKIEDTSNGNYKDFLLTLIARGG
ncbi:Annexin D4 [Morella rubra]|uniref:Annexin D4 n=1 Tax=Morella rubra TaxID=262757 RepID=A0A6A1UKB4_9ROSI|nr:Annexin D4 [Morella rubra]